MIKANPDVYKWIYIRYDMAILHHMDIFREWVFYHNLGACRFDFYDSLSEADEASRLLSETTNIKNLIARKIFDYAENIISQELNVNSLDECFYSDLDGTPLGYDYLLFWFHNYLATKSREGFHRKIEGTWL